MLHVGESNGVPFLVMPLLSGETLQERIERPGARLDLRTHDGVHPRLGVVDVVPFVPLAETSLDACVELALELGAERIVQRAIASFGSVRPTP